jgi:hypothetical protein
MTQFVIALLVLFLFCESITAPGSHHLPISHKDKVKPLKESVSPTVYSAG